MRNELNRYPVTYDEMSLEAAAVEIEQMARLIRTAPTLPNIGTFAACKFCGQLISVSDSVINELGSVEDAIEYATTHCECQEARTYTDEKRRRERAAQARQSDLIEAEEAINKQFGLETEDACPISDEVRQMLLEVTTMVYDHKIKGLTVSINSKTKAIISRNQKGKLLIDCKESDTSRAEIG